MRIFQSLGHVLRCALVVVVSVAMMNCGGGAIVTQPNPVRGSGSVFVVGTDAPLAAVLAFRVTFTSLSLSDGSSSAQLLAAPQEIEFARLNGLRTLLALQSVPAGTYTSATITLASPVISALDASVSPPVVQEIAGTLTQSSVTINLPQPVVVTTDGLIGLHVDFRLRQSVQVDAAGQITGQVTPNIALRAIPPDAPDAMIDELRGGVVSVNVAAGSFVMQGPHGRNLTVTTDAQTFFEPGEDLASLTTDTLVQVSGTLQRQTLTLRATEVLVISRSRFLLGGLITDVRPASGPATEVDVLVRTEIPDLAGIQPGRIGTVPFDGNEVFRIHHLHLPIGSLLFDADSLVAGQRVSIGGVLPPAGAPLDARRVVLHRQGIEGGWVPGSTVVISGNTGSFDLRALGINGMLFGGPIQVRTSPLTRWGGGLSGLSDLNGANPIPLRVVGLVLKAPVSGNAVVIAFAVEHLQ